MYNDELNEALESTYDDGYVQALIDMDVDPDELANESAYDADLDEALESTYNDGYVQALIDMGVDPDEIAEEDVDMNDDYDEAMEGPAREYRHRANAGRSSNDIRNERAVNGRKEIDPNTEQRYDAHLAYGRKRNLDPTSFAYREHYLATRRGEPNVYPRTKAMDKYVDKVISDDEYARRSIKAGNRAARMKQLRDDQRLVDAAYAGSKGEASRIYHK